MSLNLRPTDRICRFLGRGSWSYQGVLASPVHSSDDPCMLQFPLTPFDASCPLMTSE